MSEETKKKFADLNMTRDELNRFTEAMKKDEFRKLLVEYAEELADPVNRELYEKEIAQLEEERGMNVTFIHPEKGFCLKTTQNGDKKCFINICKNVNIEKPRSTQKRGTGEDGKPTQGLFWEIPHTCSPARDDFDKSNKIKCVVYDVVFHPDSYRMGETNQRFNAILKDSAMDTIEKNYQVKLDRSNVKVLKHLEFKGRPTACVIKKPVLNHDPPTDDDPIKPLIDQIRQHSLDKQLDERLSQKQPSKKPSQVAEATTPPPTHATPKYSIIHRGQAEMQDCMNQIDNTFVASTRPKELVVSIELPLLKSSQNVALDVFEYRLQLESNEPNYRLDLKLPYPVQEAEAKAKFDKSKRCLNVVLPVIPHDGARLDMSGSEYVFPISSDSSICNSNSSISDSSVSSSPVLTRNDPKYTLPNKCQIFESSNFISLKLSIKNYVKDSLKVRFASATCLSIKCESCSSSGCYIQYYAASVEFNWELIVSELFSERELVVNDFDENKLAFLNFIDDEWFELKFKKIDSSEEIVRSAVVSVQAGDASSLTIEIEKSQLDEVENVEALIEQQKVNNMSRKDYILNFKDIVTPAEAENDEDDDAAPTESNTKVLNSKKFEHLKFEQRKLAAKTVGIELKEKIVEESELEVEAANSSDDEAEECEKNYLQGQSNGLEVSRGDEEAVTSSLSSSASSSQLKGILKKPRSFSESESSSRPHFAQNLPARTVTVSCDSSADCASEENLNNSKKSVSFNKQVVRNIFKPNSTVMGMKKPNPNKNKKKNDKRKRTISDPSCDSNYASLREGGNNSSNTFRSRSISESSDDSANHNAVSTEEETSAADKPPTTQKSKKSKKKNKNKSAAGVGGQPQTPVEAKNPFDVETMIQWKNQGRLNDDEQQQHATSCSFKFKNKLINDLDD